MNEFDTIEKLQEAKRSLEMRLRIMIENELQAFTIQTGYSVKNIDAEFIDVTNFENFDKQRVYMLTQLHVDCGVRI